MLGGIFLEQARDQTLLARPGIGENYVKINRLEPQLAVCVVRVRDEPGKLSVVIVAGFIGAGSIPRRDEAAVNELHRQAKVMC